MIEPVKAAVRPRVFAGRTRGIVLLEDLVSEMTSSAMAQQIALFGSPASGVTTALQHIAFQFGTIPDLSVTETDRPATLYNERPAGEITRLRTHECTNPTVIKCTLAGWERDEWIEYLLSVHKSNCACVMKRVQNDADVNRIGGNPNILRQVFDELAADDALPDVRSALHRIIEKHFPDTAHRHSTARRIFHRLFRRQDPSDSAEMIFSPDLSIEQLRILYDPTILLLLAAEVAWNDLHDDSEGRSFPKDWTRILIAAIAPKVVNSPEVQIKLQSWLRSSDSEKHPLAISLLHGAGVPWKWPARTRFKFIRGLIGKRINLAGAILDQADCTSAILVRCNLSGASFANARLTRVDLRNANARGATFVKADLRRTDLTDFVGTNAQFLSANLTEAFGHRADFVGANLSLANLKAVRLVGCSFRSANLSGADLRGGRFESCSFESSQLEGADFRSANLTDADLSRQDLTLADFRFAIFRSANLEACHLEGMELPECDFSGADLDCAIMTGSIMPRANFANANLRCARLAEIDWEAANLRNADLTGATFHMGSSRSGLVDSPIPMEGSRTGFYSDEWNAQDYKSPEEIRLASLRGADLRGARIEGVDFYLVDLRDALYDMDQEDQFRRTGAILETRIC